MFVYTDEAENTQRGGTLLVAKGDDTFVLVIAVGKDSSLGQEKIKSASTALAQKIVDAL